MKSNINSAGQVKSLVVSAHPCVLQRVNGVYAAAATNCYLVVLDAAALPANGAAVLKSIPVYAGAPYYMEYTDGLVCYEGCVVAFSSTEATLTIMVAAGDKGSIDTVAEVGTGIPRNEKVTITADDSIQLVDDLRKVYSVTVTPTVSGYLMFFDAEPVDGVTVPKGNQYFPVTLNVETQLNFGPLGISSEDGIWLVHSLDPDVYTAGNAMTGYARVQPE